MSSDSFPICTVAINRVTGRAVQIMSKPYPLGPDQLPHYDAVIWGPVNCGMPVVVSHQRLAPLDRTLGCWNDPTWKRLGWCMGRVV